MAEEALNEAGSVREGSKTTLVGAVEEAGTQISSEDVICDMGRNV